MPRHRLSNLIRGNPENGTPAQFPLVVVEKSLRFKNENPLPPIVVAGRYEFLTINSSEPELGINQRRLRRSANVSIPNMPRTLLATSGTASGLKDTLSVLA